ncbi:interleukin-1 receptor-like 1 isoform X2 [Toxotes jaculatrix]|uniref:interleukin-1 receptor-like 1 isoform X2 n=1 Tax=Toxotes jaculatrix TaxID=941984 RepID=UPI001B3AA550|nr:interleukin-1 receptor-like 1 isoform X2 [Toxotes jaculatrix]
MFRHINHLGECTNFHLRVEVFSASHRGDDKFLYGNIENSDVNKKVPCPDRVEEICEKFGGNFTWYKDFNILQGNHAADLWVKKATKDHEGIYTCVCTWTHNHKVYNSSGSRRLKVKGQPESYRDPEILSPANTEQFADEGFRIQLNCSVFCGINVKRDCSARWYINGNPFNPTHGYRETTEMTNNTPKNTVTTILTIEKVSAKDFQDEFKCVGTGLYTTKNATVTLKRRGSMIPLVITSVCVLLFCVFAAVMVKCFAIDLALFFRPFFPQRRCNKDGKLYDAYVIYQMQDMDQVTEDALCQFVTETLPCVLEKKCGYQLFIYGRDDIPGEDRLERVENSVKQSRRLIVILTPGPGSGSKCTDQGSAFPQDSVIGGFDWQVGLHHALVQREMSVILIQLGDTGPKGYSHLPVGLQHLIRKSAPLKWPEGSRGAASWNSRFWKRVRYLMPATPVKKCPQAAII